MKCIMQEVRPRGAAILWPDETTSHLTKLQMQQQVIGYTWHIADRHKMKSDVSFHANSMAVEHLTFMKVSFWKYEF